ncbi:hypothetical protein DdX_20349 [Ditylenchus destructor]|uniref:Uncharacterized protein n=1 Tax=Ditylenchus destructor TaxID=166010 RepID=A0AAD4QWL9_9BILA|nr:hypothetical protein DdX_20349 [Ditylenchus destructor]
METHSASARVDLTCQGPASVRPTIDISLHLFQLLPLKNEERVFYARGLLSGIAIKHKRHTKGEMARKFFQSCEHHKEVFGLLEKREFNVEARVGFILNGDVDLDVLVALFKVNAGKITVELEYKEEGKIRSEAIKVGNVLWEKAEKKNGNVAEIAYHISNIYSQKFAFQNFHNCSQYETI